MGKSKQTARIVIIGAGASGIAAATRLLEQGFQQLQILEAENRVGGRIKTIPFADNVIDLGAQWCHGEQGNIVYQLVKDLNMLDRTGDYYGEVQHVRSNKDVITREQALDIKGLAANSLPKGLEDSQNSVGDCLTEKFWSKIAKLQPSVDNELSKELLESFKRSECSFEGADHLFEISGRTHLEYAESEGDQLLNWRDKGFHRLLSYLMKAKENQFEDLGILNGLVQLSKRVTEINWEDNEVIRIRTANGEIFTADHVICTVSLGVLQIEHKELFVPALPSSKVKAFEGLKLGTVDKIFLEFEESDLPLDFIGFYCLWLDQDLQDLRNMEYFWLESISGCHRVTHQPRLLQIWIGGEHARHMETLPEAEVLKALQWLFRKFLSFEIPEPKTFRRTQWYTNPNFRGSYSFRTIYADELNTGPWDLEAPVMSVDGCCPRLQFAGEALSKTHYSTVHGALESGWREADRLNSYYD